MTLLIIIATFLASAATALLLALNAFGAAYRTLRREEMDMVAAESWPVRTALRTSANPDRKPDRKRAAHRSASSPRGASAFPSAPCARTIPMA